MKTVIVILPGLLGPDEDASIFDRDGWSTLRPVLPTRAERISPDSQAELITTAILGLNPEDYPLETGPLWIAGTGEEPPTTSVCFRWTLGNLSEHGVLLTATVPGVDEDEWIWQQLQRLAGQRWTPIRGFGLDHGLVWEKGSLELLCKDWPDVIGKTLDQSLPEGDGDRALRQRILDSVELLSGSDFNKRRRDEGLREINIAWPWGPGLRQTLPNLPLQIGKPVQLTGNEMGIKGLAMLARSRYVDIGNPWRAQFAFNPIGVEVLWTGALLEARSSGRLEAIERFWQDLQGPLRTFAMQDSPERRQISVLSPNGQTFGLALHWDSFVNMGDGVPLHERALSDSLLRSRPLWEIVGNMLGSS